MQVASSHSLEIKYFPFIWVYPKTNKGSGEMCVMRPRRTALLAGAVPKRCAMVSCILLSKHQVITFAYDFNTPQAHLGLTLQLLHSSKRYPRALALVQKHGRYI
jgi:hypothetical protein